MAHKIEPGSIDDPGGPDMDRYYYRPGTTQPELRPELANAGTDVPSVESQMEKMPLRGKLPDDFPHVELLRAAGITTYAKARDLQGDYGSVEGIAEHRGAEIDAALGDAKEQGHA